QTNRLDWSIYDTLRETLEHIDDASDVVGLEIGGTEVQDLHTIRSFGTMSRQGFALGGYLPKKHPDPMKIALLASFDTHYICHVDYSCNRDHLHDILRESYRILQLSRNFEVSIISARRVGEARKQLGNFDAIFLPHVLAMRDELIERLIDAKCNGVKLIQDI